MVIKSVAIFCGSSFGFDEIYNEKAKELGISLGKKGITLVYGGGNKGLMGTIAHAARENGSKVIGVLPKAMNIDAVNKGSADIELHVVEDMHERKSLMYSLADGFIAMPGGLGTIEEISEIFTWKQLGYHNKNIALYNIGGYWNYFIRQLEHSQEKGFMSKKVLDCLIIDDNPKRIIEKLSIKQGELPSKI